MSAQAPAAPPGVSRLLAQLYGERGDLRGAFPDLTGADRDGLLLWAHETVPTRPVLAAPS